MGSSFVQDSFLGGAWSPHAQGRVNDPAYKSAMNVTLNGYATEEGAWIRREGFRYLAHTRGGAKAVLRAFDFSTTQPYQLEFTAGFVRFFAGLGQVTTDDGTVQVETVTTENPARLVLATNILSAWANGDRIKFTLNSQPCTGPLLCGREFILADENSTTQSYTLKDGLTGAYIDGATIDYQPSGEGATPDTVEKIFELATPYTIDQLDAIRTVQDETTVLVLHGDVQPRVIYEADPFTIAAANFVDGPYLDINNTTTTLTPSGVTGSITVTASSIVGINGGTGFQTTDVDRLIRFQSVPAAWSGAATYAKDARVTGTDGNVYTSLQGANTNHNPTTDNSSTYWTISADQVFWTWLKITARASTTQVTATVMGADLPAATASAVWRLGLFSNTTGWPSCGAYHEGRLWLSGVVGNRVDAGTSNNRDPETGEAMAIGSYCFAPTAADGTVADNNGIAAIFNSKDVNAIFWMQTTEDGLLCGTRSGVWRVKASTLDDPIAPSTIQARKISTYGCANVDPVNASRVVHVQARQRKLLTLEQISTTKYVSDNITHLADHLVTEGVEELTWQQEPSLILWSRLGDGSLTGCVFQKGETKDDTFMAFFPVEHGDDRSFISISGGPSYDGKSDALYAVTNQTDEDEDDFGVHWVEYSMPRFDAGVLDWQMYFIDGGANPCCATVLSTLGVPTGVRIYGLWHLNGKTIQPVLGGLDLGDRVVSSGHVDVPYGSDPDGVFTSSFFTGLSDGTDYGVYGLDATFAATVSPVTPPVANNVFTAEVGANTATTQGSYNGYTLLDPANDRIYEIQQRSGSIYNGIRQLTATTGTETLQKDFRGIFGAPTSLGAWSSLTTYAIGDSVTGTDTNIYTSLAGGNLNHNPVGDGEVHWTIHSGIYGAIDIAATAPLLHPDGHIYCFGDGTNKSRLNKIRASDLTYISRFGVSNSGLTGSDAGGLELGHGTMASIRVLQDDDTYTNYLVTCGNLAAGTVKEIAVTNVDAMSFLDKFTPGQDLVTATTGYVKLEHGTAYILGKDAYVSDNADPIVLYELFVHDNGVASGIAHRQVKSFVPADVDATWTLFHKCTAAAYDQLDHALIFFVQSPAGPTNTSYLCKVDIGTGAFLWKTAVNIDLVNAPTDYEMSVMKISAHKFCWYRPSSGFLVNIVDTSTGVITTQEINHGFSVTGAQYYEDNSASITFFGSFTASGSGPSVTYGNATHTILNQWGRFYLGLDQEQPDDITEYEVPCSIGFTYTSRGQLLRPDYGIDAGPRNGPTFGKKRRIHKHAAALYRTRSISFGTDFDKLKPAKLADEGQRVAAAPTLYSGIVFATIGDDYTRNGGQIAWEITRPYPATVLAVGGFLESTDE